MQEMVANRHFTIAQLYTVNYLAMRSIFDLIRAKKRGAISQPFIERVMLAVTEVNGCAMCSYAHSKMALEAGMTDVEIQNILAGDHEDIPESEAVGIMFAQHYADTMGHPSLESWDRLEEYYGQVAARGILAATRIIMLGNGLGIVLGSFTGRFKGKKDPNSHLLYEIVGILSLLIFIPLAILHALAASLVRWPIIRFKEES